MLTDYFRFTGLQVALVGNVLTVTMNNPPLNAMTEQAHNDLAHLWPIAGADKRVRVIIFTGAGEKAFSAGGDANQMIEHWGDRARWQLGMAVWRRKPKHRVLIHSDQGSQFTSMDWAAFIRAHNLEHSMSRRGNCHDNAVAESFFSSLSAMRKMEKAVCVGQRRAGATRRATIHTPLRRFPQLFPCG